MKAKTKIISALLEKIISLMVDLHLFYLNLKI